MDQMNGPMNGPNEWTDEWTKWSACPWDAVDETYNDNPQEVMVGRRWRALKLLYSI